MSRRSKMSSRRQVDDHNARGLEFFGQGRLRDAVQEWQSAFRLAPYDHRFPLNVGAAYHAMGRFAEAATLFREAIRLGPGEATAHDNLGAALKGLGDLEGAIAAHRAAIRLQPGQASMAHNLASALDAAGRTEEAMAVYDAIVRERPGDVEAMVGRGICRLTLGDPGGWRDFEARHDRLESLARQAPGVPRWRGEELKGRLLLNASLDGYGDAIQGARLIVEARRRAASVIVFCDPPIASLMARCSGVDRVVTDRAELPTVAAQTSVLGLAAVFVASPESMPGEGPYLSPDPATVERWRPTLAGAPGFRVGVVWQGDPRHVNDRRRSFRLADTAPLADVPGVRLISLQRGYGTDQIADAGFPITDLGPEFAAADMLDVAGVMAHLDLVVAADTGLAHLAGATGRPTWLALSRAGEWRWMSGREDSPWYPTMRLFRQAKPGDWGPVFRSMAAQLIPDVEPFHPGDWA